MLSVIGACRFRFAMADGNLCTCGGCVFWLLCALFVGFVRFSLDVHGDHSVDSLGLFAFIFSLFVTAPRGLQLCSTILSGGDQVDGLPPAPSSCKWALLCENMTSSYESDIVRLA